MPTCCIELLEKPTAITYLEGCDRFRADLDTGKFTDRPLDVCILRSFIDLRNAKNSDSCFFLSTSSVLNTLHMLFVTSTSPS